MARAISAGVTAADGKADRHGHGVDALGRHAGGDEVLAREGGLAGAADAAHVGGLDVTGQHVEKDRLVVGVPRA